MDHRQREEGPGRGRQLDGQQPLPRRDPGRGGLPAPPGADRAAHQHLRHRPLRDHPLRPPQRRGVRPDLPQPGGALPAGIRKHGGGPARLARRRARLGAGGGPRHAAEDLPAAARGGGPPGPGIPCALARRLGPLAGGHQHDRRPNGGGGRGHPAHYDRYHTAQGPPAAARAGAGDVPRGHGVQLRHAVRVPCGFRHLHQLRAAARAGDHPPGDPRLFAEAAGRNVHPPGGRASHARQHLQRAGRNV